MTRTDRHRPELPQLQNQLQLRLRNAMCAGNNEKRLLLIQRNRQERSTIFQSEGEDTSINNKGKPAVLEKNMNITEE